MVMQVKKAKFQGMGSVCIAQTYKDYTLITSCLLNECYTPAFVMFCHTEGRIYWTQFSSVCCSPYTSHTEQYDVICEITDCCCVAFCAVTAPHIGSSTASHPEICVGRLK